MLNLSVLHGWGEYEKGEVPYHIVNGAKSGKQIKQARDSVAWPTGAAMAARLSRTRPLSFACQLPLSFCRQGVACDLLPFAPLQLFPFVLWACTCVCLCAGIPWQSRNAKSAFPLSFSSHIPLSLSLSGLQLFCKEVPSNRVLNVKFKWQSSSNEMMLGAEN